MVMYMVSIKTYSFFRRGIMSPTDKYEANCSERHAYIFNNELFDKLERRRNSQKDVYNLSALLEKLNFTVVPYKDLTAEEMHQQLQAGT